MMNNILLIGNGLNRASDEKAWEDVLERIRSKYNIESQEQFTNYPLEFERLNLAAISNGAATTTIFKQDVASLIQCPPDLSLIEMYSSLPVENILTTNYDYSLEESLSPGFLGVKHKQSTTEKKYSLFRYNDVAGKRIWHIHGEADAPNSICIGYAHYCAYLSRLNQYLTMPAEKGHRPYLKHILVHNDSIKPCWPELFFTHNVHIVGLTLSFMEIELWWLLIYRQHLMLEEPALGIRNSIHYYFPADKGDPEQLSLMDSLGINLHPHPLIRNNWKRLYREIKRQIEDAL